MTMRLLGIGLAIGVALVAAAMADARSRDSTKSGHIEGTLWKARNGKSVETPGVVYVGKFRGQSEPTRNRERQIGQKNKKFRPKWVVVTKGGTVEFPNDDKRMHNVYSGKGTKVNDFDLGTYGPGVAESKRFRAPGVVEVRCNKHPNMEAHVVVVPNDHFAVTDDGAFTIRNVPAGKRTLNVWLPDGRKATATVRVEAGKTVTQNFLIRKGTPPKGGNTNKLGRARRYRP